MCVCVWGGGGVVVQGCVLVFSAVVVVVFIHFWSVSIPIRFKMNFNYACTDIIMHRQSEFIILNCCFRLI